MMGNMNFGFDRVASGELLEALGPSGPLGGLIGFRDADRRLRDVQLRRSQAHASRLGFRSWASLYVGLTTVLDIDHEPHRDGLDWRLRAHVTHRTAGAFNDDWRRWRPLGTLAAEWTTIKEYVARAAAEVNVRHTDSEGVVHAALCSDGNENLAVVNREASLWFRDQHTKDAEMATITRPLADAVKTADPGAAWWPGARGVMRSVGTSLDVLAVDGGGRLLAIEAKPSKALAGIVFGPVQVRTYAELFARWFDRDPDAPAAINAMCQQRFLLGLNTKRVTVEHDAPVVPVLAIGAGQRSKVALDRMRQVAAPVAQVPASDRVQPLEVWLLDESGRVREVVR